MPENLSIQRSLDELKDMIVELRKDYSVVQKTLYIGNGAKSIVSQLDILQIKSIDSSDRISSNTIEISNLHKKINDLIIEKSKFNTYLKIGIFCSTLLWFTLIIDFIIKGDISKWLISIFQ